MSLLAELKRRNVYKVAVAYAVVGWLLIQVATQVFPFFEIPNWAVRLVVLVIIAGFPIALVIAWAFEITPEGLKRTEVADQAATLSSGRKHAWIYVASIAAALSVALFFVGRYTAPRIEAVAIAPKDKSIAVLPFVNQSGDPAQEYFSDGLSEELINGLGQIHGLRVIGRNSSFHFTGKTDDSRAVGQALGVSNLIEGSVRKAGDRLRISVQLVDVSNGSQRWSQTYDRELKDVFAVQEEIAKSVANQLRVTLVGDAGNALARPSNQNLDAYNAYLQGQFYFAQRNPEATAKALALIQEAIRLDPNYAEAHFLMSRALSSAAATKGVSGRSDYEQVRQSAMRAAALKPDLAGARAALAYIDLTADCNLAAAENDLSRLAPNDSFVLAIRSIVRLVAGDGEEAATLLRKVIDSDPAFAQWHTNLALTLLRLGRYEEAESALHRALELQPRFQTVHSNLALLAVLRGQGDIALREAELEPEGVWRAESIALAQQARGDRAAANAALQNFIATYGGDFPLEVGIIYAARSEPDKAFDWLNRAYAVRQPFFFHVVTNPVLKVYYSDPRFIELCRKANFPLPK